MNAIVLAHYNFQDKNGREVNTTKIRVNLGEFGYIELCTNLANDYKIFDVVKVELSYNETRNKYIVKKVFK